MNGQWGFKTNHFFFNFRFGTLRPAIGICSLGKDGYHTLLGDVDGTEEECLESLKYLRDNYGETFLVAYRTPHGMHFITGYRGRFEDVTVRLFGVPHIDVSFIAHGVRRAYYFLENRVPISRQVFEISGAQPMRVERVI